MNTVQWKTLGWAGNNLLIVLNGRAIGSMIFKNSGYPKAEYNTEQRNIKFVTKGFFNQRLSIIFNSKLCGEVKIRMFGNPILTLTSGEQYKLCSNIWGQNVRWIKASGEPVVQYILATMISLRRGTIQISGDLSKDNEDILISSGLFIRRLVTQKVALLVIIFVPLLTRIMK